MRTELTFKGYATTLAADTSARTITGTITVFGTPAESHGIQLEAGSLEPRMPLSRVKLLRDHDHNDPVGYMTAISADATEATFYVPEGDNGDRALADARNKLRDGLSVGFRTTEYTWDDAGILLVHKAELYEVSLCAIPAFPDAQVIDVAASMATPRKETTMETTNEHEAAAPQATPDAAALTLTAEQQTQLAAMLAAGPETQPTVSRAYTEPRSASFAEVVTSVSRAIARGEGAAAVRLALNDFVPANDAGDAFLRDDWRGELWTANNHDRPMIDALGTPTPLRTGTKVKGWRWGTKPDVQPYAGNKADVPSNTPTTVPVETEVNRSAGGWDIDRIFIDLGEPGFLEAFWTAAVNDYKLDSETYAAGELIDGATIKPNAPTLLDGLGAMGAEFAALGASLDAIFIAPDLFEEYAALTQSEVPFWLANATGISLRNQSATVADLSIRTHAALDPGQVLAFDKRAATYYENTPPIRVNAIDLPKGGIDLGLFGYNAVLVNDPRAITIREIGA